MTTSGEAMSRRLPRMTVTAALAAVTVVSAVAATAVADTATQAPNSIGVRLVDVPTDRIDDPRARVAIIDHVAPGGRFTRRIEVVSTVDDTVTVDLYAGNGQIADGAFVPDDDRASGIADWITLSETQVTLAPLGRQQVEVAIDVPTNAPTGEQYGYIWVEPPASGGQVTVENRVGVRLYLSIGTGEEPPVDFQIGSMTAARDSAGAPVVTTQLRNTGGRALDIGGELSLSDGPAGLAAGPFPFDGSLSLLPGAIGSMTISLDPALPDGPWLARIDASSGLLERTAEAEILFPSEAGNEAPPEDTDTISGTDADGNDISDEIRNQRRTLLPLAAILILLAIAALYLMLLWKRREEEEDDEDEPVAAGAASAAGEDEGG